MDEKLLLFVFCSVDRCQFHFQFVSPLILFQLQNIFDCCSNFLNFDQAHYFQTWPDFTIVRNSNSSVLMINIYWYYFAVVGLLGIAWVAPGQKLRRWVSLLLLLLLVRLPLLLLLLLLLLLVSVNSQQPEGQGNCPDPDKSKSNQLKVGKIWRKIILFSGWIKLKTLFLKRSIVWQEMERKTLRTSDANTCVIVQLKI